MATFRKRRSSCCGFNNLVFKKVGLLRIRKQFSGERMASYREPTSSCSITREEGKLFHSCCRECSLHFLGSKTCLVGFIDSGEIDYATN